MTKLIVLCTETSKSHPVDSLYIRKSLNHFYEIDNSITIKPLPFNGKGNFDKPKLLKEIRESLKAKFDEKYVFYCVDTDRIDSRIEDVNLNNKIEDFCKQRGYKFVWFCANVEDVFWKENIQDSEKVKMAEKFNMSNLIKNFDENFLISKNMCKHKSNLLIEFDKILKRKKNKD